MSNIQISQSETTENDLSASAKFRRLLDFSAFKGRISNYLSLRVSELTLSQWLYFLAFIVLLFNVEEDIEEGSGLLWVGLIAGLGLIRELWHVFNRLWQQMLGKGLILVLYAATANFALAIAALKINAISGVEPAPFVFTLAFATLLMLPFWLLIASIIFFSIAIIVGNLWLVISVLLRLIKIKLQVHWEDKSFVFLTMILRLVLIPYVIVSMFFLVVPYAEQIELFKHPIQLLKETSKSADTPADTEVLEGTSESPVDDAERQQEFGEKIPLGNGVNITVSDKNALASLLSDKSQTEIGVLDKLIAGFIYQFETYPYSGCKKQAEQKSLMIDENIMLLVEQDDSPIGYKFSVAPCVVRYESVE